MKTPKELTEQQKELLGLYTEPESNWQSVPEDDSPLYVVPRIDVGLHKSGLIMYCQIWQDCIVGSVEIKFNRVNMHQALFFMGTWATFESYNDDKDAIDRLLEILEQNND